MKCCLSLFLLASPILAQPPGYYATIDTTNATTLRSTIHEVIDDHQKLPYTGSFPDTWDVLERAWQNPSNTSQIVDVYRNEAISKSLRGSGYNREHMWPSSLGFPVDGAGNYPYSDCFLLALSSPSYNSARSNKPYDNCNPSCAENPTLSTNGIGGGSGVFPGNSNWTSGSFTSGRWQVWSERKGDVARALFYVDLRYEGGVHGVTGQPEPQLELTDIQGQITSSSSNQSVARMGYLSTLLQWHLDDPVDAAEVSRCNTIASFQGNRNPFVDHPEWVAIVYGLTPPPPTGSFTAYGTGCGAGGAAAPSLIPTGVPNIGQIIQFLVTGAPANSPSALTIGASQASLPLDFLGFIGCTSYVNSVASVDQATNLFGLASIGIPIPNTPTLVGASLFSQWLILDLGAAGLATTSGVEVTIGAN